ncbi:MAG TPA: VWA domain-containing protein [Gemmatimonadales bacterium]|jgi:Ca-activated chloride channel family protein
MRFDYPQMLIAAPFIAALVGAIAWWVRAVRVERARRWSRDLGTQAQSSGRWSPVGLMVVGVLVTVAFAGPRWGSRTVITETKGLNLVVAVDISRSMLAEDGAPTRLESARRQARRLVHDLRGDRVGLIAFAGQSFILSPLTVDQSALQMLVDALDPSLTSAGGTEFATVLRQGRELLMAGDQVADRVLVLFTDGEAHDSLPGAVREAQRLATAGIHLIVVSEGGREPVPIPVRDPDGVFVEYQRDDSDEVVQTSRRDDIINSVADAARGVVVTAAREDQAAAVRELVDAYKRAPEATTTAAQDLSQAWIPLLLATLLLLAHTFTRRTMALVSLLVLAGGAREPIRAQAPRSGADRAWTSGDFAAALTHYLAIARATQGGDTAWYNVGTAALAVGDSMLARDALGRAARSAEPHLRFRALYNLGLLHLRLAARDSAGAAEHLREARRAYREALLLAPSDTAAKWNLELALRRTPPPPDGSPPPSAGAEPPPGGPQPPSGLTLQQAEQLLNSIAEEERRSRMERNRRRTVTDVRGKKNW